MNMPSFAVVTRVIRKPKVVVALVVLLAVAVGALVYMHYWYVAEAPAPSPIVAMPDSPKIQSASDLDEANDTLEEVNTVNSDFQKEEAHFKELMGELN